MNSDKIRTARDNLNFVCVHEADHLPPIDSQADVLFKYGRYLEKKSGPKDFNATARYYRIASAHGHFKANHNLQRLVSEGFADSPDPEKETIDLVEQLIRDNVPGGFYDMGHYLEHGYGVEASESKALRFFKMAADMGSPEAQAYLGNLLSPLDKAPEIARRMRQCAADQGHGDAATRLGIDLSNSGQYAEAIAAFQKGVIAGDPTSASFLESGFDGPPATDRLNYLGVASDSERVRRYKMIGEFLTAHAELNPKVPDLQMIAPLPPAKLPPWDGTFEWQKQQDAAVPAQKPSEELVERLAKEKHLDPATGLPLSEQEKFATATKVPLETTVSALEACPQAGTWRACPPSGYVATPAERTFRQGERLPLIDVEQPRVIAMLDSVLGARRMHTDGVWQLIAYSDEA